MTTPTPVPDADGRRRAASALAVVTPLAWVALLAGVVALVAGRRLGWEELTVVGATALVLLAGCTLFTIGRSNLVVGVEVRPARVRAGDRALAAVTASSATGRRTFGRAMELTVGQGVAELQVPPLPAGHVHEEVFVLPTVRRAIIPVGPATSVWSDPLGLLRRVKPWTGVQPLYVHPRTVRLAEPGSGLLRDLEGQATREVSEADVAFHALREYEPGDDRRLVHWLTTARTGTLMVRQLIDTRRSHVAVVVDGDVASYADPDEFETAVSAAASLGVRVLRDEQDLSVVVAGARLPTALGSALLDAFSGVELEDGGPDLAHGVDQLLRVSSGISAAFLVTGPQPSISALRTAASRLPIDVRVVIVRVDHAGTTGFRPVGDHVLATLGRLDDLAPLLWTVAS